MAAFGSVEIEGALATFSSALLAAGVHEVTLGGGLLAAEEGEVEMRDDKDPSGSTNGDRGGNCGCCGGCCCCMVDSVGMVLLLTAGGDSKGMMTGAGSDVDPTVGDPIGRLALAAGDEDGNGEDLIWGLADVICGDAEAVVPPPLAVTGCAGFRG
jgi:hypothetical protein